MKQTLHRWLLLVSLCSTLAENSPSLPPCPINPQYFPQSLPMHCRMPRHANPGAFPDLPQFPTLPPIPDSFFRSLPPDKHPPPIPIPIPPFPGVPMPGPIGPPGAPMPGHMGPPGAPMPGPMPGMPMPGMPMPMPMPMPVPIVGGAPHKLPVIVMPFYSPDHSYKKPRPPPHHDHKNKHKHKKKKHDSDTEDDSATDDSTSSDGKSSESSSEHGFWKGRRSARRHMPRRADRRHRMRRKESRSKKNLLTPILQYVTKDGYVIFEKQISKNEANDWLKPKDEVGLIEERHDERERDERKQNERKQIERQQVERQKIERQQEERERIEKFKNVAKQPQMQVKELRRNAENMMKKEERSRESGETGAANTQIVKVKKHRPKKVNVLMN